MQKLAVIDFDKTLVKIDSSIYFVKKYKTLDLAFWGGLRKLGMISRKTLMEKISLKMTKILTAEEILKFIQFFKTKICPIVIKEIEKLKKENAEIVVISGAPNLFIKEFCRLYDIDGYGSYHIPEQGFRHLYGAEKLKFVEENFPKERYQYYFTVSDSMSDKYLFAAFENSFLFKNNKLIKQ